MSESIEKFEGKGANKLAKLDPFLDFDKIRDVAIAISKSELAKPFMKPGQTEADPADIIGAISIGLEIGIPPMAAVSLGKTLNAKSYLSVLKGKSMGIDPITSITKIHNISTKNGDILYTSVDIISKMFLDTGTRVKFLRDYEATPKYFTMNDDATISYVGHKWKIYNEDGTVKPGFFIFEKDIHKATDVNEAKKQGLLVVFRGSGITYVTSIHFVRPDKNIDEVFHYSTQEATDAGLFRGYHSYMVTQKGDKFVPMFIEGKLNWNDNTPQMLRNRCISIPGRIFVADKLQGIYTEDEARDMGDVNIDPIQEAEEVK